MMELYSGQLMFATHENYEHLGMIEKCSGPIPLWMAEQVSDKLEKHFSCYEG